MHGPIYYYLSVETKRNQFRYTTLSIGLNPTVELAVKVAETKYFDI